MIGLMHRPSLVDIHVPIRVREEPDEFFINIINTFDITLKTFKNISYIKLLI